MKLPYYAQVDPGDLRLPPGRQDGAVLSKYIKQVQLFGASTDRMPPIEVTEGEDGELMINNGVTRAVRAYNLARGDLVRVEISDVRPTFDLSRFNHVRDVPPPTLFSG